MQKKANVTKCWTLILLFSLIITFAVAFSYWFFVPRQVDFWSLIYNETERDLSPEISMPSNLIPVELKLKNKPPFIYQILH
ncbi:uncharacterized protein Dwil_GK27060 [Drosophila willistoni]|uniref:Uncharacterized protein n=1 Tax=Drosophila willistoni TaxID=7260 RepID=A0A0Q9WV58_DROWI|nr:uncharacterized protein LOC26529062 [Drosophila willistoni]KRG00011.1 uncharacterized protein Dwil_GK27060 [Drosophila willistoni]